MGIKILNLQMIPWCFHFLGNSISCLQIQHEQVHPPIRSTIKLVKSDGLVKIYDRPIHASELMTEYPKHLVCRSDSFYIGQKIPALSEKDQLQLGQKYFLLPKHFFQTVLSFVTIASFASSSLSSHQSSRDSRNAFLKKAAACQPFDLQKTPSGCPRIRVSEEFISQLMEEGGRINENGEENEEGLSKIKSKVCTTPQLQKDYTQLIGSSRQWKPKLETIRETEKRKLSAFGMKRRKKTQSKTTQKIQRSTTLLDHHRHHHQQQQLQATSSTTKPPSKSKIKFRSRKPSSSPSSSS